MHYIGVIYQNWGKFRCGSLGPNSPVIFSKNIFQSFSVILWPQFAKNRMQKYAFIFRLLKFYDGPLKFSQAFNFERPGIWEVHGWTLRKWQFYNGFEAD